MLPAAEVPLSELNPVQLVAMLQRSAPADAAASDDMQVAAAAGVAHPGQNGSGAAATDQPSGTEIYHVSKSLNMLPVRPAVWRFTWAMSIHCWASHARCPTSSSAGNGASVMSAAAATPWQGGHILGAGPHDAAQRAAAGSADDAALLDMDRRLSCGIDDLDLAAAAAADHAESWGLESWA